ncbi:MAG: outer membrane protein transport protein [Paracoccus sp. (in: a-proteobacteria)]|uniref:OmpP1/FadL family transporter n=1 Tax=Paracoccus sp. TaxID=267 RepID=UPI0026DFEFC2|nr:outer membrane protein transport protein [Paracoccus sp. (in: a-proteobacteria)]MDO5632816.1 outer membrane protein transport protein [Paracoccus sp. (in: a-proteobacteria)]
MKSALRGFAALMLSAAPVMAGGLERAPQSIAILFEEGNYAELGFGRAKPSISGQDTALFGGSSFGNVSDAYNFFSLGYKHQFSPNLSVAFIVEQPFGADIRYPAASIALGGTAVTVDSTTYTALLRYKFDNNFGVHGGLRGSTADGNVTLSGMAYSSLNGYNVTLDSDTGWGYAIGASWEKPEIAARVSLTYNSPVSHDFRTVETINGNPINPAGSSNTEIDTPKSWNLEFQTGVAPDTLVFGSVRWVEWSAFRVEPAIFANIPSPTTGQPLGSLVELEDSTTYTLGVARKFTENWSGAASFSWEKSGNDLVSPLAPTNGRRGITLAGIYTQDNFKVTAGINYTKLGDSTPATAGTARAEMTDNDFVGVGIKIGYSF